MDAVRLRVLSKGAEAVLYLELWYGILAVRKVRISKPYRNPALDLKLRQMRTLHEARLLAEARRLGVPAPAVLDIDLRTMSLLMEYVEGSRLRDVLDRLPPSRLSEIFREVGRNVGRLHQGGIVHGDLTTSNMILTASGNVFLIDFGLGLRSDDLEDRGVDVHLMLRALESTHPEVAGLCFESFMKGYAEVLGEREAIRVRKKVGEIRARGRYVPAELRKG